MSINVGKNLGTRPTWIYLLAALVVVGCAGATVTPQSQSAPLTNAPPTQIVVYPFAVNPSDVTLNQSIVQRAYRSMSGEDQSAQQSQVAHDAAQNVCVEVVSALTAKGYNAVCQQRGVPVSGSNTLVVDGEFTDISEGNRLRRLVIGLGAGASTLDTSVEVYQRSDGASHQVLQFTTHADSGKMPGAAIMGPAGAAASGSAVAAVGVNVAAGGVKNYTSATGYLGDKTASQIVDSLTAYYSQQGWAS